MSQAAKLGVSVGLGGLTTVLTDSAIQYFAPSVNVETTKPNWYYKYSSLLGGGASLITAGVLYKLWGKEEAVVAGLAGVLTALAVPTRLFVEAKASLSGMRNVRQLAAVAAAAR
jgi:uncharacterized membrane protein YkgB